MKNQTYTLLAKHPHQCYHWTANEAKMMWPFWNTATLQMVTGSLWIWNKSHSIKENQMKKIKKILQQNAARPNQGHFLSVTSCSCSCIPAPPWPGEPPPWAQQEQQELRFGHNCLALLFPYKNKITTKRQTSFHILTDDESKDVMVFIESWATKKKNVSQMNWAFFFKCSNTLLLIWIANPSYCKVIQEF